MPDCLIENVASAYIPRQNPDRTGHAKNNRFEETLVKARKRGMSPLYVLFDTWYCRIGNLNLVTRLGWHFLTRLKSNRIVRTDGRNIQVSDAPISGMAELSTSRSM